MDDNPPPSPLNPDGLDEFTISDRELLVLILKRMDWLIEKIRVSNGHGNSVLMRVVWTALGASGIASMMALASLIAWIVVAAR